MIKLILLLLLLLTIKVEYLLSLLLDIGEAVLLTLGRVEERLVIYLLTLTLGDPIEVID